MKRTPLKRKKYLNRYSRKTDYIKALQKKAERLWKEAGLLIHGKQCEVKKYFPDLRITHTPIIQGDHCISRANKYFFLDINNHSSVCSSCNQAKAFGNKSVQRAIDEIVEKRNPGWFESAVWIDQTHEPNLSWKDPIWLEEKIKDLEELIK